MMRLFTVILLAGTLAACTGGSPRNHTSGLDQTRNVSPHSGATGVSISGLAHIGVAKTF